MNEQAQWWAGSAGDQYTKRNRVNWLKRVPFWTEILMWTQAGDILEVGCNAGWNLLAIRAIRNAALSGIDVNPTAVRQAKALGLHVEQGTIEKFVASYRNSFELAFTAGALIHVPFDALEQTMRDIAACSTQYVLAIEYESLDEQEVIYRGERGRLWKRPYGRLYEALGLREVDSGYAKPEDGFDNCTWWLMQK